MKDINLTLNRNNVTSNCTFGYLEISTNPAKTFTTLEPLHHSPKLPPPAGNRVRSGRYRVNFRKVLSPLTIRYREKFPWFTWHLELQDVVDFTNVYIHIGNSVENTLACILVGNNVNLEKEIITDSTSAYTALYSYLKGHLTAGGKVWITILDEEYP